MRLRYLFALLLVLLVGAFFRFHLLHELPGGLFPDEAANGLDVLSMQRGDVQPFYERGNGREALFFYLLWGNVELFGKGPWQHHAVSAGVGLLAVLLCFAVTRRLLATPDGKPTSRGTWVALLAAFLMAVSSWHVVLSRTAFRANLVPLLAGLAIYLFLRARQAETPRARAWFSVATGAAFAGGLYTYISFRVMFPLLALVLFLELLGALRRSELGAALRRWWKPFLFGLLSFAIVVAPIARYFYQHPGSFSGRSGQVSVFSPSLNGGHLAGTIGEVFQRSVLAYFTDGDLNWRHNVSGEPFLPNLASPFFGGALVIVTLLAAWYVFAPNRRRDWVRWALLAGWFWSMLLPVVATAEGIPHGLRSIGTIPAVFMLAALGLSESYRFLSAFISRSGASRFILPAVAAAFLSAAVYQTYNLYFVGAANSPEYAYAFRSDLTPVSRYLTARCRREETYLVLDKFSVQTTDYLTTVDARTDHPCNVPYRQVDPENVQDLSGLKSGDEIVFTQSSVFDIPRFKQRHPEARLVVEARNQFTQAVMGVYRIP